MVKEKVAVRASADAKEIEQRAIGLIPKEIDGFLVNASSVRTRFLLVPREFNGLFNRARDSDVLGTALVRLFASELIRKAGVRHFGKTPQYNAAKLGVRAAILRFLEEHPETKREFLKVVTRRERGLFGKTRKPSRRILRK